MITQYPPIRGQLWRHLNGNEYVVLFITNTAVTRDSHPPDVVYATKSYEGDKVKAIASDIPSYNPEKIWSRPLTDWHRSFTRINSD